LVKLFSQYGVIVQEDFMWHRDGPKKGQPRGYAFVEYKTRGEAEKAISQLDGKPLLGRAMVVRFAEGSKGTREGKKSGAGAADKERQIAAIRKKLRSMEEKVPSGGG
jgi:RNA recognition motif-containing protein